VEYLVGDSVFSLTLCEQERYQTTYILGTPPLLRGPITQTLHNPSGHLHDNVMDLRQQGMSSMSSEATTGPLHSTIFMPTTTPRGDGNGFHRIPQYHLPAVATDSQMHSKSCMFLEEELSTVSCILRLHLCMTRAMLKFWFQARI
jgi:hypothetical protein